MIGYQCLCGQEVPKKELKAEFKTGREYQLRMERPECAREVLEYIKKNHPGIKNEVPGREKEKKGKEKDGKGNSGSH